MATVSAAQRLDELLSGPVGRDNFDELVRHLYDSYTSVDLAHNRIKQMEADLEKLEGDQERDAREKIGILHFAMGNLQAAIETLSAVRNRKAASHFLGRSHLGLGHEAEALNYLEKGGTGDDDLATDILIVETHCRLRQVTEAEKAIKPHASRSLDSPDLLCALGRVADLKGEYGEATEYYQAALEKDPEHPQSLFRLALNYDLNGDDSQAIKLYRRCVSLTPTYVGALMNLGVLYEDHGMYAEAIDCYKRVLAIDPRHKQAQLYLKDAESSLNMFIDLSRIRRMQQMQETFSLPVSNFELSARSRSTLDRMDIRTLGGLTKVSREDLLGEKNFGDTSLTEIEDLLDRYDLELGARPEDQGAAGAPRGPEDEAALEKLNVPIEELDFSTRCRKCMDKLGVTTVGALAQLSEMQLLDTPNFGVTSLQEVQDKLAALGLSLRTE